jgi:RimJ/RimL family protein N-acetyltransferase
MKRRPGTPYTYQISGDNMLTGECVGLRAIEERDLDQLLQWRNNPSLRKYFREYRELSDATQRLWYSNKIIKDPNTLMFSIIDPDDDRLLGACGLCYIDWKNRNADFSLYIGIDQLYIDCKYALDAGKLLLAFGFNELNLHRIYVEVFDFDKPKRELLKTLHFVYEGINRDKQWCEGRWHASEYYGILATEYTGKK